MISNIWSYEYGLVNDLQKELHQSNENRDEKLASLFFREFMRTSWYVPIKAKLSSHVVGNEIIASIDNTAHYLMTIYKMRTFPKVAVRKELADSVQICCSHNHGTNDMIKGSLYLDQNLCQTIDSVWCDIHSQFFTKPGFDKHMDKCHGNLPHLEDWSTVIPSHKTSVILPFYHCRNPGLAIPIFYFRSTDKLEYRFNMIDNISQLIRMRVKNPETGEWTETSVDLEALDTTKDGILPSPEFWGEYANITEEELEFFKGCAMEFEKTTKVGEREIKTTINQDRIIYTEDIGIHDNPNPSSYGETVTVALDSKFPTKAIFPVAQNVKAHNLGNLSNYTTCQTDLYRGWSPMSHLGLKYTGTDRIPLMDIEHFDTIEPFKMLSAPRDPGYAVMVNSIDLNSINTDIGVRYGTCGAQLIVKLGNTDPFTGDSHAKGETKNSNSLVERLLKGNLKTNESSDKFRVRVRTLNIRRLVISRMDSGFKITFN